MSPTTTSTIEEEKESQVRVKINQSPQLEANSSSENDTPVKDGPNSGPEECQLSLSNSLSPTVSMDSQKSAPTNPSEDPPKKTEFEDNPILKILKESLLSKDSINGQSRELLFQLGNHLMNLATSQEDHKVQEPEVKPSPLRKEEKLKAPFIPNIPPQVLLNAKYRETAFTCSCNEEFENLYIFTIHMKDTGHKPKASPADKDIPKLVRGQDMWINSETEQTKEILRCMHCQQSFRSLPELTMHMIKTNHYSEIVYQDVNGMKNGKKDSDSVDSGKSSGRSSKKSSPDKSMALKRKASEKEETIQEKRSKIPINLKAKMEELDSEENPLFSLQKLVNITSDAPPNKDGSEDIHRPNNEASFFDLFQRLDQMNQSNSQMAEENRAREASNLQNPQHFQQSASGLTKKAKCHFCGKPFANKGQVRLHISKNKCPSLLQKNVQTPFAAKPFNGKKNTSEGSATTEKKPDLQFTNPHLNAAFNLLQRQFPDEKKPVERSRLQEEPKAQNVDSNGLMNFSNIFSLLNQAKQPPQVEINDQSMLFQQQLATLATLLPLLSQNKTPNVPTSQPGLNFNLLTSLFNPQVNANPFLNIGGVDPNFESCLTMAKQLVACQKPDQVVND